VPGAIASDRMPVLQVRIPPRAAGVNIRMRTL
jgi:hypothetical protein